VIDMKIIEMKLTGSAWVVTMEGGFKFFMGRQGKETLADAAARFEDTIRALQAGEMKPANTFLKLVS
jgi:hypothetical protein